MAIYSAHKFLGGPTAGIVAGGKPLVRAAFLQNMGIGRGMKVGKEGIVGAYRGSKASDVLVSLEQYEARKMAAAKAAAVAEDDGN